MSGTELAYGAPSGGFGPERLRRHWICNELGHVGALRYQSRQRDNIRVFRVMYGAEFDNVRVIEATLRMLDSDFSGQVREGSALRLRAVRCYPLRRHGGRSPPLSCYAAATRCPVLTWRMRPDRHSEPDLGGQRATGGQLLVIRARALRGPRYSSRAILPGHVSAARNGRGFRGGYRRRSYLLRMSSTNLTYTPAGRPTSSVLA
eukprot:3354376-Rhodomonas_salina.2